jgi:ABC-type transport system involved in multi-copper enzyme maturation permease subunit
MNAIVALVQQDFRRLLKNALFWVVSATLILILLAIHFIFPKSMVMSPPLLVSFQASAYEKITQVLESEADVRQAVAEQQAIGFLEDDQGQTIILHSGLSEKTVTALMMTLQAEQELIRIEILHPQEATPFNLQMLPLLITFEALILSLILVGTLMLSEKQEETVKAMRIAPVSVRRYITGKIVLFGLVGSLYAGLMALFTVGISLNWVAFLLISALGSIIFTLMGLAITPFFRDLNGWFFSIAVLLTINMLSGVGYSNPSSQLFWMKLLPSYPFLSAYDDILFGSGLQWTSLFPMLIWIAILSLLAHLAVHRVFFRKGGVFA